MLTRRHLLATAPALLAPKRARNVLFFAVDDLNVRLGTYGAAVRSPQIDGLARAGVRFDRAYCQYPLCNPSRTSLLTGMRPPRTKVMGNQTWFRRTLPDTVTLPQHFRENGYWTAVTGKIFHGGLDDDKGWVAGGTPLRENAPRPANRAQTADRWEAVEDEEKLADYRTASRAIEYLEQRPADQPFFLACGFLKPHVPLIAPKKYFELYDAAKMPLPEDFAPLPSGTGPAYRSNFDLFINRQATPELAREALRAYYACVSFTDAQVGRVLAALDRLKLREDTAIVLFGDHGWHLGEKGMWSKMSLFEASTRVPLMVSAPGMSRGKGCARTVELIDLYPTLSDLCGLRGPANLEGRSLRPLLENPGASWDKPAYTFITRGKVSGATVRDERFRYTEWDAGGEGRELYDHSNDPMESRNLAEQPAHAATVARMQGLLRRG